MSKSAHNIVQDERRKQRHELKQAIPVIDQQTGKSIGTLVNITLEGVLLLCNQPLDINRIYQVKLELPTPIEGQDGIELAVDCLWTNQGESQDINWAGCQIIDASNPAISAIDLLIRDYSTGSA